MKFQSKYLMLNVSLPTKKYFIKTILGIYNEINATVNTVASS